MSSLREFPEGTSIQEALNLIIENSDDLVRGFVTGVLTMLDISGSIGLNLSTVIGVSELGTPNVWDGYMLSITPDLRTASLPYDKIGKVALAQRFIGVNEQGRAVKLLVAGNDTRRMIRVVK